ncbi:MAG: bifunctional UDP-sugar hydrolase/5'-nucleotidase [Pseudomonadota bacterium]
MRRVRSLLLVVVFVLCGCRSGDHEHEHGSEEPTAHGPQPSAPPSQAPDLWLSIAVTNDIHGYLEPQPWFLPAADGGQRRDAIGGVEWLAGYLEILRARDPVLLLDAGDMFQGTLISNAVNGASVVAAMNHLGYKAAAVGNHEFDFGKERPEDADPFSALKARAAEADFPFLAANIYDRTTGTTVAWPGVASHVIVEVAGLKVAVLGGTTLDTPKVSLPSVGDILDFRPLEEVLPPLAKRLRAEGADVIIAVVHAGGGCDGGTPADDLSTCEPESEIFRLARAMDPGDVDLIAGGHTHRIISHRVNGIPVIEGGAYLRSFSLVRLRWSRTEERVTGLDLEGPVGLCHEIPEGWESCVAFRRDDMGRVAPVGRRPATFLGKAVQPVPFLDSILDDRLRAGLEAAREPLGPVVVRPLNKGGHGDHPVGLLEADILLDSYKKASVALVNESGIRAGLPQGAITYGDLFQVFPFKSLPALMELTGRELLDLLRLACSGAHGLPVVAGIRLVVDRAQDDCIREDWNGDGVREPWERHLLVSATLADGAPIDPDATYVVVSNSYLASGGSDFNRVLDKIPGERKTTPEEIPIRDVVARWLRGHPDVRLGEGDYGYDAGERARVEVLNPNHLLGSTCRDPLSRNEKTGLSP